MSQEESSGNQLQGKQPLESRLTGTVRAFIVPFLLKGWCWKDGLVIFQAGNPHLFREDAGVWPQMDCPGHP